VQWCVDHNVRVHGHGLGYACRVDWLRNYTAKSDGMFALAKQLKEEGVPIDGVGFQMHLGTDLNRSKGHGLSTDEDYCKSLSNNPQRFSSVGLDLWITELDVGIDPKNDLQSELQRQADIYGKVVEIAVKIPRLAGIKCWGIMDRTAWNAVIPERPNLFDEKGNPKEAFYRVQSALKRAP
jgi:endo-1,4-beta-xylanase